MTIGTKVIIDLPEEDAMRGWNGAVGTITEADGAIYFVEGDGFALWADTTQVIAVTDRLEELRAILRAENMSWGELAELQGLAEHIDPGDVELLEAAGVPEFPDEDEPEPSIPSPKSGDLCSFGRPPAPPHYVTHYRCDDYADGTVVNALDGTIITPAKPDAQRGFHR